jgi:hypothetical protein
MRASRSTTNVKESISVTVEALVSLRVISLFALDARNRLFERGDAA